MYVMPRYSVTNHVESHNKFNVDFSHISCQETLVHLWTVAQNKCWP